MHSQLWGMPRQPSTAPSKRPATTPPGWRRRPRPRTLVGSGTPLLRARAALPTALAARTTVVARMSIIARTPPSASRTTPFTPPMRLPSWMSVWTSTSE